MRIVRYDGGRFGVATEAGIHDLIALIPEWTPATADSAYNLFIERYPLLQVEIEGRLSSPPDRSMTSVRLDAPVAPRQLLAAPRNFTAHQNEMKGHLTMGGGSPADLGFFLKATGCVVGPRDHVELPALPDRRFDYEGEVAFVIGREARSVTPADALQHIFGYTILIDMSMRMTETLREERVMRKSYHSFAPIGPWIVTADEIPDPSALHLRTWINGELRQDATLAELIVDIPALLAQASAVVTLQPGDVYATGTPAGVGPVEPGDAIAVEVSSIGRLELPVSQRAW